MTIDDLLASSSLKHSKVIIQFMERQSNRSTTLNEKSLKVEFDYLCEPCIDRLCECPLHGFTREDLTNICAFQCSQRSSSLFVHRALPLSVFFLLVKELSYLEEEG